MVYYVVTFSVIFFGICALINFKFGKRIAGFLSLLLTMVALFLLIGGRIIHKESPGYHSAKSALNYAEKHDQVALALDGYDDAGALGWVNGRSVAIMKNEGNAGYSFNHNGKYYYILRRVTNVDDRDSFKTDFNYEYDAIPINCHKKYLSSKLENVSYSWLGGNGKVALNDSYDHATRFN